MAAVTWDLPDAMWRAFTVDVEGATLCGEMRGDGAPLVLVHGMGSSRAGWDGVIARLPENLPLLRYDLRGFGASAANETVEYSHSEDLLAILDATGIARASLCGLSMGGAICTSFAIAHAKRMTKLVLASPALVGWEWSEDWRTQWRSVAQAATSGNMAQARALWWQHPMFTAARENAGAAGALHAEIEAFAGRQWVVDRQRPALPDVERLHLITAPTLLLTGGRDTDDFRLIASLLEASIPDMRRIDFPDAGHLLPLERASETARAIADFLGV